MAAAARTFETISFVGVVNSSVAAGLVGIALGIWVRGGGAVGVGLWGWAMLALRSEGLRFLLVGVRFVSNSFLGFCKKFVGGHMHFSLTSQKRVYRGSHPPPYPLRALCLPHSPLIY